MDKKYILILINAFLFLSTRAQVEKEKVTVPMSLETKNFPFTLGGVCIGEIYNGSRDKFKGIPEFLTKGNSIIKTIYFGKNNSLNKTFYLIIGDKNTGERICIIDTNNNLNFSDDYQYNYNDSFVQKDMKTLEQPLHFKYTYKNQEIERNLYLRPDFNRGSLKYVNPIEQKYFIIFRLSEYRLGSFSFKDKKYIVAAAMPTPRAVYDSETVFSIIKPDEKFPLNTNALDFYKTGETIFSGNSRFKINGITPYGDSLYIEYMGKRNLKETGYEKGFYAPKITSHALNGAIFNLDDYGGKFVLIDFWGTWCGPCIALIPSLRKIHGQYKNLVLVSVACQDKDTEVVKAAIKKYCMDWINLYDPFKPNQSISNSFRINSYPTTLLIAPDGKIIFRGGSQDFNSLEQILKKNL